MGQQLNLKKENSMYNYGPMKRHDMIYVDGTRGGPGSVSGVSRGGYHMNQSMISGHSMGVKSAMIRTRGRMPKSLM
jgi:hypothetical protein